MTCAFYKSIIEEEINDFGIKKKSLIVAANSVGIAYSQKALKEGKTFCDYNLPSNRCAYLYKYASIHTGLVTKYFQKLTKKKEIKSILLRKKSLKICCLGGGPGTDIVGLFKALARNPHYHKKVVEVTVLDICGGWRNSFKRIISNLMSGKIKDVPTTFFDDGNFKFELLAVDLLNNLPTSVVTILSEADIVCMVKFVSAILGSSASVSAIQAIASNFKTDAIVLFIDNFQGSVFQPFTDIAGQVGLNIVLGPIHEAFNNKTGFTRAPNTVAEKEMFGCLPLNNTKISVLAFIKKAEPCNIDSSENINICLHNEVYDVNSWDTDEESEEISDKQSSTSEILTKVNSDKFTQTDLKYIQMDSAMPSDSHMGNDNVKKLSLLVNALCDLVNVMNQWHEQMRLKMHCCHCH